VAPVVFVLIAAGALAAWRGGGRAMPDAWSHAAYWTVLGLAMSLTPLVLWNDRPIRLPQAWLQTWVPISRFVRVPSRLGIIALIGVAMLAGLAFAALSDCLASRRRALAPLLAAVAVAVIYAQYSRGFDWPFPRSPLPPSYPLQPALARADPLVEQLRSGQGPVLELPINLPGQPFPDPEAAAMYRSIFHWRPLVNGYSSYFPAAFPRRMQAAMGLPDAPSLARLRAETGITSIVVHGAALAPAERERWLAAQGASPDLRLVWRGGDDMLFAVTGP